MMHYAILCVYIHQAGRTPALQHNWQSSEKSPNFKEKSIFNEHPVLDPLFIMRPLQITFTIRSYVCMSGFPICQLALIAPKSICFITNMSQFAL